MQQCTREWQALYAKRITRTLTLFKSRLMSITVPPYIEAYINRCSIAYKGLKWTTPKCISSILKKNSEGGWTSE